MSKVNGAIAIGLALAGLALPTPVQAVVIYNYDAAADLLANEQPDGSETNPNGAWSYGGYSAAGTAVTNSTGAFTLYTSGQHRNTEWAANFNGWSTGTGVAVPAITVNIDPINGHSPCCGITNIDPLSIFVHPGPGTGALDDPAIRWTAPFSGLVDISANFKQRHDTPQLGQVAVNGVIVFAANASGGSGTSYSSLAIPVLAGDTISFIVNNNPQGYGAGSTQVAAFVTLSVPEPASVALLGFGAIGLLIANRRRTAI